MDITLLQISLPVVGAAFLVALLLNAGFVYNGAKAIWNSGGGLATAWVLMFLATGLWIYREESVTGIGSLDTSALMQIGFVAVAGAILLSMVMRGVNLGLFSMTPTAAFLLYGVVAFISAGVSPAVALTLYKSGLILADALLVVVAISKLRKGGNPRAMIDLTYALSIFFLFCVVLGGILFPEKAVRQVGGVLGYNLNGVIPVLNANDVGFFAAVGAALGLRRMWEPVPLRQRLLWMSLAAMGFAVLFFAQARTSIVALAIVIVVYAIAIKRMRPMAVALVGALAMLGSYYLLTSQSAGFEEVTADYLKRGQSDEMVATMSGREGLWGMGFRMFADSPLLGHGFEAGVKYGGAPYGIAEGLHMHNAHMQVLVNSGILGYGAWITFIAATSLALMRRVTGNFPARDPDARYQIEMFGVLMLILLRTFTGSVLVFHHCSLLLLLAMLVYLKALRPRAPLAEEQPADIPETGPARLLATRKRAVPRAG